MRMMRHATIAALALIAALPVRADTWLLLEEPSEIGFTYFENEEPYRGRFPAFAGTAEFDAARPAETQVEVTVTTAEVELADFVRTAFAKTEGWFDTVGHPQAFLTLDRLIPVTRTEWEGVAQLTVKGITREIRPRFVLTRPGNCLRARGEVEIPMADFEIGQGRISRFIRVGESVILDFNLLGHPEGIAPDCI